jgi:hypothetical protein
MRHIGHRNRLLQPPVVSRLARQPASGQNVGVRNRLGPRVGQLQIQPLFRPRRKLRLQRMVAAAPRRIRPGCPGPGTAETAAAPALTDPRNPGNGLRIPAATAAAESNGWLNSAPSERYCGSTSFTRTNPLPIRVPRVPKYVTSQFIRGSSSRSTVSDQFWNIGIRPSPAR